MLTLIILSSPVPITGAGADFVMLGGMFAGHDQCAGEVIEKNGKKVKLFYGMSSDTAMKKHAGGVAEYRYQFYSVFGLRVQFHFFKLLSFECWC